MKELNPQSTNPVSAAGECSVSPTPNLKGKAMGGGKHSIETPSGTRLMGEFCVLSSSWS